MNILVTGGAGYVGSILISVLLSEGHKVRVLDRLMYGGQSLLGVWSDNAFEFVYSDVRDRGAVRSALEETDAVVHLAAIVGDPACEQDPELARSVNLDASLMVLEESKRSNSSRFIFASTCSNYGKMDDPHQFVDETSELHPVSLYAKTKVSAEKEVLNPDQTRGLCATSLRFATVFGVSPRMRFDLTVNHFTMQLLTKKELLIFGKQFWRPYVHVRDVARAVLKVLEAPVDKVHNEVFNVGSTDQNYQKKSLVKLIQPYASGATIEYVHKEDDPRDYRVSFAKIKNVLNFETTYTVNDGVREVARLVSDGIIRDYGNPRFRNSQ